MRTTIMIHGLISILNMVIHAKLKSGLKRIQVQYIFIVHKTKAMIVVLMLTLMDAIVMTEMEVNVRVKYILYIMVPGVK